TQTFCLSVGRGESGALLNLAWRTSRAAPEPRSRERAVLESRLQPVPTARPPQGGTPAPAAVGSAAAMALASRIATTPRSIARARAAPLCDSVRVVGSPSVPRVRALAVERIAEGYLRLPMPRA